MKSLKLFCLIGILIIANHACGAIAVIDNMGPQNIPWVIPGLSNPNTLGTGQTYDTRSFTITGGAGTKIDSISFNIGFNAGDRYDDSLAFDLNGDGTADWAYTQNDAYASSGVTGYNPWNNATPFSATVTVTQTGTTVAATWNGVTINAGSATTLAGFDNANLITLQSLGFGADGSIPNDNFTTSDIRIGSFNISGPLQSNQEFEFVPNSNGELITFVLVPEPNLTLFSLIGVMTLSLARRMRQRAETAPST